MVALSFVGAVGLLSACSATADNAGLNTLLKLDTTRPTFVFFWESG